MSVSSRTSVRHVQVITVSKNTSLGLSLVGGTSRTEGSQIYIKDIIPGGDCHTDGRLRPGDQLVSVNKEPLLGVSCEEAKIVLNRAKLRSGSVWEIAFSRPGDTHTEHIPESEESAPAPVTTSTPRSAKSNVESRNIRTPRPQSRASQDALSSGANPVSNPAFLNPDARFKVEKLELALNYLGLNPTEEQKHLIRQSIQPDSNGSIAFGDFVQVVRNIFNLQLEKQDIGSAPAMSRENRITSTNSDQVQSCDPSASGGQMDNAFMEIKKLKDSLLESERQNNQLAEESKSVKQEAKAAVEEARSLRSRIHLAEAAQRQARGVEMDYEEVIRLLEAEITELRAQLADHSGHNKDNKQDLQRRITVLGCQLRKSEMTRKTFEVSTEKLLQFVESVPEVLADEMSSTLNLSERVPAISSQMARFGPSRRGFLAALASEAKELARSVRSIVEVDCLPYGWEEAYTADGIKYFINHVTQTTSWTHPVTGALILSGPENVIEDCRRDAADSKSS